MQTTQLPYRFKEASFRRYERIIADAVDMYPKSVHITCNDMSPETVSCRLLDAMTSLETNHWETALNMEKFLQLRKEDSLCVRVLEDSTIYVGPKAKTKELNAKTTFSVSDKTKWTMETCDEDTLRALVTLLSKRIFTEVLITKPEKEILNLVHALQANHDIAYRVDGNRLTIL